MADIPDGQDKHILISWIWDCAKTRKVHCVEQRHWAKESKVLRFQIEGAGYGEKIRRALEFVLTVETGLHSSERAALEAGWDGFCSGDCVDKKKTKEKKLSFPVKENEWKINLVYTCKCLCNVFSQSFQLLQLIKHSLLNVTDLVFHQMTARKHSH